MEFQASTLEEKHELGAPIKTLLSDVSFWCQGMHATYE